LQTLIVTVKYVTGESVGNKKSSKLRDSVEISGHCKDRACAWFVRAQT